MEYFFTYWSAILTAKNHNFTFFMQVKVKRHKRPPDPTDPVVIAAAAAAAKKAAAKEEAERKLLESQNKMSSLENLKYYTSLLLGTLCIINVFAFLFLVPFVLDPAISTLNHKYVIRSILIC